jgi:hypothetical protein
MAKQGRKLDTILVLIVAQTITITEKRSLRRWMKTSTIYETNRHLTGDMGSMLRLTQQSDKRDIKKLVVI